MTKWIVMTMMALGISYHAQAADEYNTGAAPAKGPCANDMQTYCGTVQMGEGRMMKCMRENESKMSAECKEHMNSMKAAMKEVKEVCQDDWHKFCKDVKPGKGRIMSCMKEHKADFSQACQDEMAKMKKKHKRG